MKRVALVAVPLTAAAIAVLVWTGRRDREAPPPAPAPAPRAERAVPTAPPPPRALPAGPPAVPAPREPAAEAVGEADEPPDEVKRQLEDLVERLHHAGRRCVEGRPVAPAPPGEPDETMDRVRIRVQAAYAGGVATIAVLEKVAEGFRDTGLERCVLDAIRAARWDTAEEDGSIGLEHTLYVGAVMTRGPLDEPPRVTPPPAPPPAGIPLPTTPPPPPPT